MNYIELIRGFWRSHEEHLFTPTEIAVYFYLVEVCNICQWKNPFKRNNAKIGADLSISFNTLKNARNKLQQVGLVSFKTLNGSPNVIYTLSNFDKVSHEVTNEVGYKVSHEVTNEVGYKVSDEVINEVLPTKDKLNKTKQNKGIDKEKPNRFLCPSKNEVIDFFMSMENLKPSEAEIRANSFYTHHSKNVWAGVEEWRGLAKDWKQTPVAKTKGSFTPPTVANVFEYFTADRGLSIQDAEYWANRFVDFYTSKGWKVGSQSMKDWKAAARNCVRDWDDKRQKPGYTHPAAKHQQTPETDKRF